MYVVFGGVLCVLEKCLLLKYEVLVLIVCGVDGCLVVFLFV